MSAELPKREPTPSVGRIVHFMYGDKHYAAIITDPAFFTTATDAFESITEQALTVFPPNETPFTTVARHDPNYKPGTWHWPEYVP